MSAVRSKRPPALGEDALGLLQAIPLPAAILDAHGNVLHANDAMRERAGQSDPTQLPGAKVTTSPLGRCVFLLPEAAPDPQMQRLASLGFMLAGVSHEVSNPLAAIHSMVQILQSKRGVTPETLEKGLESIAGSVVRVLAITRKLGNFSRTAGDAPEPQPLDAAVGEALSLLRHSRLGDAVQVSYDGMPDATTRARPGELQQVLFNVFLNAAQAMDGKGRIDVTAERVAPRQLRVRVRDTGPGIAEDALQRVFEPFFTTKPPGDGTGLGLAISYEIVQELGGSMSAGNHPEGGACVEIVLPEAR
jgi:C4-dicarboxylate-specific signal transduction histidine kinase